MGVLEPCKAETPEKNFGFELSFSRVETILLFEIHIARD